MEGKRKRYYERIKIKYSLRLAKTVKSARVVCWDNEVKVRYFCNQTGEVVEETFRPHDAVRDLPPGYRLIEVCFDANKDGRCQIEMSGKKGNRLGIIQMEKIGNAFDVVEFGMDGI